MLVDIDWLAVDLHGDAASIDAGLVESDVVAALSCQDTCSRWLPLIVNL